MHLGRKVERKGVLRQKDMLSVVPSSQVRVVLKGLSIILLYQHGGSQVTPQRAAKKCFLLFPRFDYGVPLIIG